jgi:hypothetical protein
VEMLKQLIKVRGMAGLKGANDLPLNVALKFLFKIGTQHSSPW